MLEVYCFNINNLNLEQLGIDFANLMSEKYKTLEHKKQSFSAWNMLYKILKEKYNIVLSKDKIIYKDNKKPALINDELYFNISHSDEYIAVAISDCEVGIDIEKNSKMEKKTFDILKICNENDKKEIEDYKSSKTKLWVWKEAFIKLNNSFISINNLKNTPKIDNEMIFEFVDEKGEKYCLAVINNKNEKINIINFEGVVYEIL